MSKIAISMLAVWAAALGSAGALAYTLNRPPTPVARIADIFPSADEVLREQPPPPPGEAVAAPAVVVQETIQVHARKAARPAHVRELSEMRCVSWANLMQGSASQQVRRCE